MRRVAVIAYTDYATDGRVRREAETLATAGYDVSAIVVGRPGRQQPANHGRVHVYHIPIPIRRGGRARYAYQYITFFLLSGTLLLRLHLRRRFDLVHVHSLPDFEVFSAAPLKITRTPIILDLHEAMPEIFSARFGAGPESLQVRVASFLERMSCGFADHVITANDGIRSAVVARGTPAVRVTSVYNALETVPQVPAAELVRKTYGLPAGRLLVHAGGINPERDLETLLRATALLPETLSCGIVLVGEGEPAYVASLRTLAHSLGLADRTWFLGRLPISAARALSSLSEVGVVTLQSNPLTRLAWPNRIAEFVAFHRSLVLPDLPFLRSVMGDSARYYVPGNPASLAQELEATMLDAPRESLGSALGERAARALDWPSMRREYLGICARLTGT